MQHSINCNIIHIFSNRYLVIGHKVKASENELELVIKNNKIEVCTSIAG